MEKTADHIKGAAYDAVRQPQFEAFTLYQPTKTPEKSEAFIAKPSHPATTLTSKPRPAKNSWTLSQALAQCQQTGYLWEDPDFPADDSSISRSLDKSVDWLRPQQVVEYPKFVSDDKSRFDVTQGELGDCWLLAAIANVTLDATLISKVVPPNQTFYHDEYCGAFQFNFWHFGEWVSVVVDDRLPTRRNKLMYLQSAERNEFWSSLLEKAYAKLLGCYDDLHGGFTTEAMTDLTGGFCESLKLHEHSASSLMEIMQKANERGSLMCCSINQDPNMPTMAHLSNGLIMGHAYSVTEVEAVEMTNGQSVVLVRLRNPWGDAEWNERFSDHSEDWYAIPSQERERIQLNSVEDGEFWMLFQEFFDIFDTVELCHTSMDSFAEGDSSSRRRRKKEWKKTLITGEWRANESAGGCRNYEDTFAVNPQIRILLDKADDNSSLCTLLIGLMQRDARETNSEPFAIGFSIYHVTEEDFYRDRLDRDFFERNVSTARSKFSFLREVSGRFQLEPGYYVIVPSTYAPNEETQFVLRIYAENEFAVNETKRAATTTTVDDDPPTNRTNRHVAIIHKNDNQNFSYENGCKCVII